MLEAGLAAGIPLPYSCANGSCGECQARLLNGTTHKQRHHDYHLSESDKLNGAFLMCSHRATGDVEMEVHEANNLADIPLQSLQAKLSHVELINDVLILRLKFIRGKALRFLPGQSAELDFGRIGSIVLPISSCPCESSVVEFHLSQVETNSAEAEIGKYLLQKPKDKITINGPLRGVSMPGSGSNPQLFIATGIEFRYVQGMIEQLFNIETSVAIALIWLASGESGYYRGNLCRSWDDAFSQFTFIRADNLEQLAPQLDTQFTQRFTQATFYHGAIESGIESLLDQFKISSANCVDYLQA